MPNGTLNYAPDDRRRRVSVPVLILVLAVVLAYPTWTTLEGAVTEYRLSQEEARLLSANAPQECWPTVSVSVTPAGYLVLPDGRHARLAQMLVPNNRSDLTSQLNTVLAACLDHYRSQQVGYTILKTDPDGTPVINVWALGPRAYAGICGNSSWIEKRQLSMRLWRNIGVVVAEEGAFPVDPNCPPGPMSVLGWR